jgi:CubicO group peptidase (beta-lactamase class C family)
MKNYIIPSLLLFLGTTFTSQAQAPVISQEVKENIISRVDKEITPAIVVGVVNADGITYFSYGVKSLKTKELVDENSIFELGSISKTFTGILLADMVVKGEIDLDEPLQNLLPEGITAPTKDGKSIKLFHLSDHTSGLPRLPNNMNPSNPANPYADYTEKEMYDFLNSYELTRSIGSEFEYSNYAVGLLGNVLAAKRNMTYEELMLEIIAQPLGMKNTAIVFTPKMRENLAYGHNTGLEVENWDLPTLAGAGAIRSSAVDMIKYISANMGILESDLYSPMRLSHQITSDEEIEQKVGLGWIIDESDSVEYIWHNGATGGYNTFTGFKKDGSLGVIVLTNSESGVTDIGMHILDPSKALSDPKPSIATKVKHILDNKGIRKATKVYWIIKKNEEEAYDFGEEQLNALGYSYLQKNEIKKAISIFELNVEAFPTSSNAYDSYAEALMKNKENKKAIKNYKKSVELNPGNTNAIEMLKKLGVETKDMVEEIIVEDAVLESYVGDYELAPGFILTISKDGSQLNAQATGQGAASIYPKSNNEFYYKIVDAQVVFNLNEAGEVESLTLFQGGQELVGVKQ